MGHVLGALVHERRYGGGDLATEEPHLVAGLGDEGDGAGVVGVVGLALEQELVSLVEAPHDLLAVAKGDADRLGEEARGVSDARVLVTREYLVRAGKEVVGDGRCVLRAAVGCRCGIAVEDIAHHELGLGPALPGLVDGVEDQVDRSVVVDRDVDARRAEHDGRDPARPVGRDEAQVLAAGANARAAPHADATRREQRLLVALAKGLEHLEGLDGGDGELVEPHHGGNLVVRDELVGG